MSDNDTVASRPVPPPNTYVHTQPFWDGAKEGKFMLQYCKDTGQFQYQPRPVSIYTGSRNLEWREASGKGIIYACTVVRVPGPGIKDRIPLMAAIVELEEGVRVMANILEAEPDDMKIGQKVELVWDTLDDGVPYPAFKIVQE